jgi:hypothetical protein
MGYILNCANRRTARLQKLPKTPIPPHLQRNRMRYRHHKHRTVRAIMPFPKLHLYIYNQALIGTPSVKMYIAMRKDSSPCVQNPSPASAFFRYFDSPDLSTHSTCRRSALRFGHFFRNESKSSPMRYGKGITGLETSCSYTSIVKNGE